MRSLTELKIAAAQNIKEKDYWISKLSGEPVKSSFPYDQQKTNLDPHPAAAVTFKWDGPLFTRLMGLSKQNDHALHVILLTALAALMHRYTGIEDITVGTPIYRQQTEGEFINTVLPVRNRLKPGITFKELLVQVKQTVLEAVEHQAYPVELLPELLNLPVSPDGFPLFDTALVLENIQDKQYIEHIGLNMVFRFLKTPGNIKITVDYNASRCRKAAVERMIIHFNQLLQNTLSNPGLMVSCIEILPGGERNQLLFDFNDTAADYPRAKTIHQLFEEQVERTPDNIALLGPKLHITNYKLQTNSKSQITKHKRVSMTYKGLNRESHQLACLLREKGIKPGSIVGIMVERSLEMMVAIFAILKAGGAYLPIEPGYPEERINYMLADSDANVLVTTPGVFEEAKKRRSVEEKKNIEIVFANAPGSSHFFASVLPRFLASGSSSLAYIIYTSGTTGKPKGVMIEHRNVVRLMFNDKFLFDFNCQDTWTMFHSYCFDFSVWEMYGALLYGGKLVVVPQMAARDFLRYLEILKKNQVTILNQTPSAFYNLMDIELENLRGELNIRYVIFGGEALTPSRLKKWKAMYPAAKLINMYGITETTVHVTFKEITGKEIGSDTSNIGRPIPTLTTYIMDKHLKPVPTGAAGELVVGGEGVGRGYLNRQELTNEKIVENPYKPGERLYRSGDLVRLSDNGDLEYLGRIDHQVKIRGFRIETGEIESQLLRHKEIKEAVVAVKEDKGGDKYLCAYIVPRSPTRTPLSGSRLMDYLATKLPGYMIPSYFVQVDSIPLNPSGKIDRKALPEPDPTIAAGDSYAAPQGETETRLAVLWSEVLDIGKEHIGRDTGFFKIGGHSLKATALISKIHKEFNAAVSMMDVFDFPKLKDLASCIKKAGAAGYSYIRPAEERDYYSLSSAQKRLYVIQQGDPRDTTYNITTIGILEGIPDQTRIENAFRRLIERHESLRTSFHIFGKEPVQRIHKKVDFELEYYDGGSIKNVSRPFDLARAPLLQVGLIKTAEAKYILAADMHHIISDAISLQVLLEEFMRLYRGETLPALRLQYKDFSQWQNSLVLSGQMKKQEDDWLNRFKGKLPVLKIPTDYPRPLNRSFAGSHTDFEVSTAAVAKLRHLANKENVSLFMVVLALCNVLFFKLSGQEDIIVGTAAAGRTHADLEHIIGVFANTLALRNNPSGDTSFIQFLKEVRQRTLEAFDNQEYQFQDLVDRVLKERDPNRNPLFDVMVNFNPQDAAPAQETAITNPADTDRQLEFKPYTGYQYQESRFDLLISGSDTGDRFQFTVEYSTQLFKEETIQRFSQYFREIIAAVVEDETVRLKDIPISINLASAEAGTFRDDDGDFAF